MSLYELRVSREEVLKIVKENKEKHDIVFNDAVEGYWLQAESFVKKYEKESLDNINKTHKESLRQMRKRRKENIKLIKSNTKHDLELIKSRDKSKGFKYWSGQYPENHSDDYEGTIRRLELCVDSHLNLNNSEFDSYIRNKWEWRNSFITNNTGYVASATTFFGSGSCGIGTSSPSTRLSVSGYAGTSSFSLTPMSVASYSVSGSSIQSYYNTHAVSSSYSILSNF